MKRNESAKQAKAQENQVEITFPYMYSKPGYSVSVKIYKTPRQDYDAYTLIYYQDAVRKRVLFSTVEAALEEADDVVKLLGSKVVNVLELRSADKAAYRRARELLDPLGVSIEVAHKPAPVVVTELLAAKLADGCRPRYLQALRYNLGK